jgi:hypothetical protein
VVYVVISKTKNKIPPAAILIDEASAKVVMNTVVCPHQCESIKPLHTSRARCGAEKSSELVTHEQISFLVRSRG